MGSWHGLVNSQRRWHCSRLLAKAVRRAGVRELGTRRPTMGVPLMILVLEERTCTSRSGHVSRGRSVPLGPDRRGVFLGAQLS